MLIKLTRTHKLDGCTIGVLQVGENVYNTLEKPWLNNSPNISCIPLGHYKFVPHGWDLNSKLKYKNVWRLLSVQGRSAILIHAGNKAKHTMGCILVGKGVNIRNGKASVTDSMDAINELRELLYTNDGEIEIKDL